MFQVFQMTKGESSDELILGDPSPHDESRRVKKRNRVLQSCIPCHELRRKCDRQRPCTRCSEHGMAGQCVYQLEDPMTRALPDQDELSRLRRRVAELEHTVRVLTQRGSPEGGIDERVMQAITGRVSSPNEGESLTRKKGRRDEPQSAETRSQSTSSAPSGGASTASPSSTAPSMRIPGMGHHQQPSYTFTSPHGSPTGGFAMTTGSPPRPQRGISPGLSGHSASQSGPTTRQVAHCGCVFSTAGREVLGQLQANLNGSIQRMKGLPEHQIHGVTCPLYQQMNSFSELLSSVGPTTSTSVSSQQMSLSTSLPPTLYSNLQASAASTSPISGSPPQDLHHHMSSFAQRQSTFDLASPLQPTHPYPFTSSHSSTLSHSLSQPHLPTTSSHPQSSYAQAPMASLGSSTHGYQGYQPHAQQSSSQQQQQQSPTSPTVPYSGYTSLSTWNSMTASPQTSSAQRGSSRQIRGPAPGPSRGTR